MESPKKDVKPCHKRQYKRRKLPPKGVDFDKLQLEGRIVRKF